MNKEKLETICFKVIEFGTHLVLLTPLIFFREWFHPVTAPKAFFFGTVVSFIFIAYVLLAVFNPRYRPRITPLTLVIFVFLAVLTVTSITGLNFERSFFGSFSRGVGLLTFFYLFAFYIVLISCFKERKYWERMLAVSVAVCVFVSLSVLLIFLDDAFNLGGGTMGNSSFFSAYLLFNLFFALMLLVIKRGRIRIFYGLVFALFLLFLFSNPGAFTKGAAAAFFFAIIVLIFSCLFYLNRKKAVFLLLLILILTVSGLVFSLQFDFAREKAIDFRESSSVQSRAAAWQISWHGWQERFWLGWGHENFSVPFARHFDPQIVISDDSWFDRAHNIVLDTGVSSGILGVISYLFIFCLAFFGLIKKLLLKGIKEENATIYFIMIAVLAAYFFQNLWVFDTVSSYLMFFLSLAFINFLLYPQKEKPSSGAGFLSVFMGFVLISATIVAFYQGSLQPARASKLIGQGPVQLSEEAVSGFQKAFEVFPPVSREGSVYLSSSIKFFVLREDLDKELTYRLFELAEKHLKKAVLQNPLDCRLYLFLGEHYNYFYKLDYNEEKLALAEQYLEKALELSPNLQKAHFALAQTRFFQGEDEKAFEILQKIKELEPRYKKVMWHLAIEYARIGEYELAVIELKELEDFRFSCRDVAYLATARAFFKQDGQDIDIFITLCKKGVEDTPKRSCFRTELIETYIEAGEEEKAREALKEWFDF